MQSWDPFKTLLRDCQGCQYGKSLPVRSYPEGPLGGLLSKIVDLIPGDLRSPRSPRIGEL